MIDKVQKNQIADILLDFYDEYDSNVINRPMIPNIYAGKILDSLQEEPVSEELEDATNNYCVNVRKGYPRVMDETDRYICNAFKAGAKWQKAKEEPVSEDLKTELNEYIKCHFTIDTEQLDKFGIEEKDYMYSMDKSDMLALVEHFTNWQKEQEYTCYEEAFEDGAKWKKEQMMANTADAMIGLPYENKDGGYTHLIDVSRPLPVGNNKIAIIFKEE